MDGIVPRSFGDAMRGLTERAFQGRIENGLGAGFVFRVFAAGIPGLRGCWSFTMSWPEPWAAEIETA